jgi:hypothetical protein
MQLGGGGEEHSVRRQIGDDSSTGWSHEHVVRTEANCDRIDLSNFAWGSPLLNELDIILFSIQLRHGGAKGFEQRLSILDVEMELSKSDAMGVCRNKFGDKNAGERSAASSAFPKGGYLGTPGHAERQRLITSLAMNAAGMRIQIHGR